MVKEYHFLVMTQEMMLGPRQAVCRRSVWRHNTFPRVKDLDMVLE